MASCPTLDQWDNAVVVRRSAAAVAALLPTAPADLINARLDYTDGPWPSLAPALTFAISSDLVEMFRVILACEKTNRNAKDQRGWTAVHEAAYSRNSTFLKELLAHPEVDVNTQSGDPDCPGTTALHLATGRNDKVNVGLLLERPELVSTYRRRRCRRYDCV